MSIYTSTSSAASTLYLHVALWVLKSGGYTRCAPQGNKIRRDVMPAQVAAATAGLDEPSSEDDDEEPEEGGMLADVDNSGEDSDASPEGANWLGLG